MARKRLGSCTYCRRDLAKPTARSKCALTKDHVMPKAVGGTRKVNCCRQCNQLKGDIHPSAWRWFTVHYPGWWRTYRTNAEVVAICSAKFGKRVCTSIVGRAPRSTFLEPANEGAGPLPLTGT